MTNETAIKLIIKACVNEECSKRRDITSNGSPVYGANSEQATAVLIIVEQDIEKKIERLLKGENIYSILPELESEAEYDKEI